MRRGRLRPGRPGDCPTRDTGLSLIEMLVALLVLGVVLASFAGVAVAAFAAVRRAGAQTDADQVAGGIMESMQNLRWTAFVPPASAPTFPPVSRSGATYTSLVTTSWRPGCVDRLLLVRVEVRWTTGSDQQRMLAVEGLRSPSASEQVVSPGSASCAP